VVPRIRAWLHRRAAVGGAMSEVPLVSRRFGLSGRCDVIVPRPDGPPFVGELKSGFAAREDAPGRTNGSGPDGLRLVHAAQARLYALLWTDGWKRLTDDGKPKAESREPKPVEAEVFYAGSDAAYRVHPAGRELSELLSTRNSMLDLLRRTAEGEPPPDPAGVVEDCGRCWRRAECPWAGGPGLSGDRISDFGTSDSANREPRTANRSPQSAYVRHFDRALVRSVRHSQGEQRELLESGRLRSRVKAMTAEADLVLEIAPADRRTAWLVGFHRAVLRPDSGAPYVAHRGDVTALDAFRCDVAEVLPDRYRLRLRHPLPPWIRPGPGWIAEEDRRVHAGREGFEGLARLAWRRQPDLFRALIDTPDGGHPSATPGPSALPPCPFPGGWHASQAEAFARAMGGGAIEAIQGPPGTGKTVFVGSLVAALVASGLRVLVGALTHGAVDQAARRIVEMAIPFEWLGTAPEEEVR
ncbi:MAG: AAA domain-containing protein, partial [Myxococcota bacterium]|nr:AAA domain-containing protein [Myxococcota bacterium]